MKKYLFIIMLLILFSSPIFSQSESGGALGFGYDMAFANYSEFIWK